MIRINKYLSLCGVTSRRGAEQLIKESRVTVNDITATSPGQIIEEEKDIVRVDGSEIKPARKRVYILFNKPKRVLTSLHDPFRRKTVSQFFKKLGTRVYPVGRLDYDTDGVLIMTNDGELAYRLAHPRYNIRKIYRAFVKGTLTSEEVKNIEDGVRLQDGYLAKAKATILKTGLRNSKVRVIMTEGRKREVKHIMKAIGHPVLDLRRTEFAGLRIGQLKPGRWRFLNTEEIDRLKKMVELDGK